ncbi:hypothetical protein AA0114_g12423 [Alternaria tenuissima]|uniref:Rhodopsin domain-containing protein n=1 Tax=Alternaria tenuissima TaxID=119927 RepID=A0A4Q4M1B6_9PLEO|nr:hypothetical protein AA0114_g12423 [Alternaria tenuissima]
MGLWDVEDYGIIADRACWSMFAVTASFVALRVGTRISSKGGGLGMDDYITVFCVVVMLVTCILITIGTQYGLGRRMEAIDPPLIPRALKWNVIISSALIWTFSLPKFAIIAILKRILDYGLKTTILFWGLALSSQACILATSIWWYKQCDPVEFGWDRTMPGGKCASTKVMSDLGYFTSAYSAFLDVFFALYPIPFIMRLNMPLKNRILVSIALGLSILASILTIYKLTIFGEIFVVLAENPTYPVPLLDILGLEEGCILVVCSSLPTLGPLFRLTRGKVRTLSGSKTISQGRRSSATHRGLSSTSGRWDKLQGHQLGDEERTSSHAGESIDDIPLVYHGADQIHKTLEFEVTTSASGDRRAKPIDDCDT